MRTRTMPDDWSARQYLKFEDERTRPPRDLLAQVPLRSARRVFDLGCGPANSTELLIERFPEAEVIGLDSSPDMLAQARERLPKAEFDAGGSDDLEAARGDRSLFGNAVFQWVPDHAAVLARLLQSLPEGGVLAVQMPDNTDEPCACADARGGQQGAVGRDACQGQSRARRVAEAWETITTCCGRFAPRSTSGTRSTTT